MATALVTGSNRGIGLELCRQLRERGDAVIAVCRKSSPELDQLGVRIEAGVDVSDPKAVNDLAGRLAGSRIDLLVNNAGILLPDALGSLDVKNLLKQLETNALAPLLLTEKLLPLLERGGKVALITSRMGSIADNTSGAMYGYRMSKAALNAAGMSLARDLASRSIAVVILHPGYVKTEMTGSRGSVDPADSARDLIRRVDELRIETTGRFLHANGQELPW